MIAESLPSIRELDGRVSDGMQVRLLWSADDNQVWVSVLDTRSGAGFRLQVDGSERPTDVFHHPFAYAAHHGIDACTTDVQLPSVDMVA